VTRLSRETEALLERGRGGTPLTAAHRARLKDAVLARATGLAVATSTASAAAWTSLGAKIAYGVVLVAAVGGTGAAIGARVSNNRSPGPLATLAVNSGGALLATPPSAAPFTQTPTAISTPAVPGAAASTGSSVSSTTSTAILASTRLPAPIWRVGSSSAAGAIPVGGPTAPTGVPATVASTLEREVRLLRDADRATKGGEPGRALALLDEHAAAFPRSDLEPERSAERVFALCAAGRIEEARSATRTFLAAHPEGPLAARVKDACRGGARE
jgi:hypothetical protein